MIHQFSNLAPFLPLSISSQELHTNHDWHQVINTILAIIISIGISVHGFKLLRRQSNHSNRFLIYTHYHSPIIDQANQGTLRSILNKSCPSLVGPNAYFSPTPWLFSGHLQTIYSAFADFSRVDLINYERRIIKVPDGGQIALDFTPPNRFSNKNDPTPTLIVLHGLTGGSHESYVRSLISPLTKEFGWRAVVTNFRGCAGSKLTSPKLYKFANHFFYHMISSVLLFHKKEKKVAQVYLWLDISLPVLLIHI